MVCRSNTSQYSDSRGSIAGCACVVCRSNTSQYSDRRGSIAGCACVVCRSNTSQYSDSRGSLWSGELSKNTAGFGYSEKQVTIALDSAGASASGSKADVKPVKEVPLWMSRSTVDTSDYADRQLQQQVPLVYFHFISDLVTVVSSQCTWSQVPLIYFHFISDLVTVVSSQCTWSQVPLVYFHFISDLVTVVSSQCTWSQVASRLLSFHLWFSYCSLKPVHLISRCLWPIHIPRLVGWVAQW